MAESFVKTIKPDVRTALRNLAIAFEHYYRAAPSLTTWKMEAWCMCPRDAHKHAAAVKVAADDNERRSSNRNTAADTGHGAIGSRALFGTRQVLLIEHDGCRYRLSAMRQHTLILGK